MVENLISSLEKSLDLPEVETNRFDDPLHFAAGAYFQGLYALQSNSLEKARDIFVTLHNSSTKSNSDPMEAYARVGLTQFCLLRSNLREAIEYHHLAQENLANSKEELNYLRTLHTLLAGEIQVRLGALDSATEYFGNAIRKSTEYGFQRLRIITLQLLSNLHLTSGNYGKALTIAEEVESFLVTVEAPKERIQSARARQMTICIQLGEEKRAEQIAVALLKEELSDILLVTVETSLAKLFSKHREDAKFYDHIERAKALAFSTKRPRLFTNVLSVGSEGFLIRNEYEKCIEWGAQAFASATEIQDIYHKIEITKTLYEAYKKIGNINVALEYLEHHHELTKRNSQTELDQALEINSMRNELEMERKRFETQTKKSELLRIKLDYKERELTEKIRHLIMQAEAVRQFRNDLRSLVRRTPADDPSVKDIRARLASFTEEEINWQEFEKDFKEAHPEFLQTLSEKYPDLTKMEQRIAAMIRMDLKSADIAKLFCITERAVEFHRLNLRKKLQLKKTDQLTKFLSGL